MKSKNISFESVVEQPLSKAASILEEKVVGWLESTISILPNFVVSVLVVILFYLLALVTGKLVAKLIRKTQANETVVRLCQTSVRLVLIFTGLFVALSILQLEKTVTSLLAGAGVIGLALGFAFQEMASNYISGIFIAFQKPYRVGDIIKVHSSEEFFGTVEEINLRTTSIQTFDGLEVLIPNKALFTNALINFTSSPLRRVEINIGVAYSTDLEKAAEVAKNAVKDMDCVVKEKSVQVFYEEFGASSINFMLFFWVQYPGNFDYLIARHKAIIAVKKAFDEHGITIPFPIRTLDIPKSVLETMRPRELDQSK